MAVKHNESKTRLYKLWQSIKNRCFLESNANYKHYGALGITMCDEWANKENGYDNFKKWAIENGYKIELDDKGRNKLSLDRINGKKGYSPNNCKWATSQEQAYNRSTNLENKIDILISDLIVYSKIKNLDMDYIIAKIKENW